MSEPPALDPSIVGDVLRSQFPHVAARDVRLLSVQGADHAAYEVDGEWVVRFPKVAAQVKRVGIEYRIVRAIADRLPIPVPRFELTGRPSERFPFVFTGYRKLACVAWDEVEPWPRVSDAVAEQLGGFLTALHGVPLAETEGAGVMSDVSVTLRGRFNEASELRPRIEPKLPSDLRYVVDQFIDGGIGEVGDYAGPLVLVHNDLLAEHVLVDPHQACVSGIIDWGDVSTGDPAIDFVGLHCFAGGAFVRDILRHYRRPYDDRLIGRAAFIARCLALGDFAGAGDPGRYPLRRAIHHVRMAFS